MKPIDSVGFTGLFWETLAQYRGHGQYAGIRRAIDDLLLRKSQDRSPINSRDKSFTGGKSMDGIWHCAIYRTLDLVLFYRYEGDRLVLSMLGDHGDYPFAGKNLSRADVTANKINRAVSDGHVPSPGWKSIAWKRPSDLVGHRELAEASQRELHRIASELAAEAADGQIFRRLFGMDVLSTDDATLDAWLAEIEEAHKEVFEAISAKPLACDEWLARLRDRNSERLRTFGS